MTTIHHLKKVNKTNPVKLFADGVVQLRASKHVIDQNCLF